MCLLLSKQTSFFQDKTWSMPTQPFCNETSWVYLGGASKGMGGESGCDVNSNHSSCLELGFTIVPFQVGGFNYILSRWSRDREFGVVLHRSLGVLRWCL